jgi:glycosyltransferase involved in cell wall biosynthesis
VDEDEPPPRPRRLAVVGISTSATCGVRDHATLLAQELERQQVACTLHWLAREQRSLRGARAEIGAWTRTLGVELAGARPHAILLHYSVFSYSHRGVPLFVHAAVAPLRRAGVPLLSFMHELAYPFGIGGARGCLWAATQRAALPELVGASSGVIVTADFRASWVSSRRWLPGRPVLVAPVFSNIPSAPPRAGGETGVIGLFGYSYESAQLTLILEALSRLRDRGLAVELRLLGAPGASSAAGRAWSEAAHARGVGAGVSFAGVLPAERLADELAACDVLVYADASGPTARKGTLAASLASGVPVVAIDGPLTWRELRVRRAAAIVSPDPAAVAEAIAGLLADAPARGALGARGREFARSEMSLAGSARVVRRLLERALAERAG